MKPIGKRLKLLGTQKLEGIKCKHCNSKEMNVRAFSVYFVFLYIPMFPIGKKYETVCLKCDTKQSQSEMSNSVKERIAMQKHHFKTPKYVYAGLFVIALMIAYMIYHRNHEDQTLHDRVQQPQPKDLIIFKGRAPEYAIAKITAVKNDTVYMVYGNYTTLDALPSYEDVKKEMQTTEDYFGEETYTFTKSQIDSLYRIAEIVKIYRDQ